VLTKSRPKDLHLQMASVQEIKGYLVERYRDLGLINLVEMYR
jgi:hypothetical protein